jgi:hypothetical protein
MGSREGAVSESKEHGMGSREGEWRAPSHGGFVPSRDFVRDVCLSEASRADVRVIVAVWVLGRAKNALYLLACLPNCSPLRSKERGSFTCKASPYLSHRSQLVARRTDRSGEFVHGGSGSGSGSGKGSIEELSWRAACRPHL